MALILTQGLVCLCSFLSIAKHSIQKHSTETGCLSCSDLAPLPGLGLPFLLTNLKTINDGEKTNNDDNEENINNFEGDVEEELR